MQRLLILLCLAACAGAAERETTHTLAEFSGALERLAARVAPAVVQVQVSAWCASPAANGEETGTLTSCGVIGSGVIVDPSGYIITNEHVVRNAHRIHVMLTPKPDYSADEPVSAGRRQVLDALVVGANREPIGKRQVLDAVVVGANRETDIALLKIDGSGLPTIPIDQTWKGPRQGQVVVAVGSPEGLDNTMTIGIVSAVGRQPYPDYPMLFIQTDAAINPGNSGGPLLNVEGELIGINTFMFSENGRNQGLGFAVPAGAVRYVYEQLRNYGFVRQSLFGVHVQTITPTLAQGLGLARGYGVMVSDVLPGSPADSAGIQPCDIITAIDGSSISALPYFAAMTYLHDPTVPLGVTALRGEKTLQFQVPAIPAYDQGAGEGSIDPLESLIPELGIFGKTVDRALSRPNGLRSNTGVYVVATLGGNPTSGMGLVPGDVIASLNAMPIPGVPELRGMIHELAGSGPAVLQIERHGQFFYIERELGRREIEPSMDPRRKGVPTTESGQETH